MTVIAIGRNAAAQMETFVEKRERLPLGSLVRFFLILPKNAFDSPGEQFSYRGPSSVGQRLCLAKDFACKSDFDLVFAHSATLLHSTAFGRTLTAVSSDSPPNTTDRSEN